MSSSLASPADAGYTLIELVVVLLLAGLIGTAVAGGLQFGTRVWEHAESTMARAQAQETAQSILREVLASAIPLMKGGFVRFRGEPTTLEFDGPPPSAFAKAGLAHMQLSLTHGESGMNLVFKATSLIDTRNSRATDLVKHVGDLRFSYLDSTEKIPIWLAFWRDRDRLPDAVRIEEVGQTEHASWPAFVVRLPIAQDANCIFDPVSTGCRKS